VTDKVADALALEVVCEAPTRCSEPNGGAVKALARLRGQSHCDAALAAKRSPSRVMTLQPNLAARRAKASIRSSSIHRGSKKLRFPSYFRAF
jgi:hypothetical protein